MLQSLLAYARGAGVDARWLTIGGNEEFFRVTKRIHNRLHGAPGDGGRLEKAEREIYESALLESASELTGLVRDGDVVYLHDPQTAGLAPHIKSTRGQRCLALSRRPGPSQRSRAGGVVLSLKLRGGGRRLCLFAGRPLPGRAWTRRSSGWLPHRSTPSRRRTRTWTPKPFKRSWPGRAYGGWRSAPSFQRQDGTRARVDRPRRARSGGPNPAGGSTDRPGFSMGPAQRPGRRPQLLRRELQRPHGAPAARGPLGSRGCR